MVFWRRPRYRSRSAAGHPRRIKHIHARMNDALQILQLLLDWSAAVAWPFVTLIIVLIIRKPVVKLLSRFETVAQRAETEAFDLQLGEKLKISFRQALESANPQTVEEAVEVAEQEARKTKGVRSIYWTT